MFGKNPIMKQDLTDGRSLRVVEGSPFYTIQGEGPFAGHPAVFVRLHGCNLRCWFCDTEFSNPADPDIAVVRLARLVYDEARMHEGRFRAAPARLVVITGGEPLRQNIIPLVEMLLLNGYDVQIETAGSLWIEGLDRFFDMKWGKHFHIVCSPKTGKIHEKIFQYATSFKYVVGKDTKVDDAGMIHGNTQREDAALRPLAAPRPGCPVYLSPMDEYDEAANATNRKRVGKLCLEHGYIAGVQMHKLMEIVEP
jgi:7-carboxy-7-deazaguanine synthase